MVYVNSSGTLRISYTGNDGLPYSDDVFGIRENTALLKELDDLPDPILFIQDHLDTLGDKMYQFATA